MKRFVYNQKYARLLVSMFDKTSQIDELARTINANAGHLRIVLDQWHKEGVIIKIREGRDYKITLTEKGNALATKLGELMDINDRWEQNKKESKKTKLVQHSVEVTLPKGIAKISNAAGKKINKTHEVKKDEPTNEKSNTVQDRTTKA